MKSTRPSRHPRRPLQSIAPPSAQNARSPRRPLPARQLTVSYSYSPSRRKHPLLTAVPYLRLRGRWLQDAGFGVDQPVCIRVQRNRIVITPVGS